MMKCPLCGESIFPLREGDALSIVGTKEGNKTFHKKCLDAYCCCALSGEEIKGPPYCEICHHHKVEKSKN